MTTAIKVENLSKKYLINYQKKTDRYETFSDTLVQGSKNIAERIMHPFSKKEVDSQTKEEFWALKDINFEIKQGDKVGIIGRNGAGKSTLLKILSRITEPTSGKIHIYGRIASLLEVGTGFHPELSGRENIYLNGAILGMSRQEIRAKFDEIVAFSGIEKFLDTPVKRYSSGMYVRLAFSVAAHLEPEILVIDEVLAVGDAEFQKKCLGKMGEVSKEGRTVLFVSHNMSAIMQLTNKTIVLGSGQIVFDGNSALGVEKYGEMMTRQTIKDIYLSEGLRLTNFQYLQTDLVFFNDDITFSLDLESREKVEDIHILLTLTNSMGHKVLTAKTHIESIDAGSSHVNLVLAKHNIVPGRYMIGFSISSLQDVLFSEEDFDIFEYAANCSNEQLLIPHVSRGQDKIGTFISMRNRVNYPVDRDIVS